MMSRNRLSFRESSLADSLNLKELMEPEEPKGKHGLRRGISLSLPDCLLDVIVSDALLKGEGLPPEEAVKLSNTDLFDLVNARELDDDQMSKQYRKTSDSEIV